MGKKQRGVSQVATAQMLQQISVAMHTSRALIFGIAKNTLTTNERPNQSQRSMLERSIDVRLPPVDDWFRVGSQRHHSYSSLAGASAATNSLAPASRQH